MESTSLTYGIELEAIELDPAKAACLRERGVELHYDGSLLNDRGIKLLKGQGGELVTPILDAKFDAGESGHGAVVSPDASGVQIVADICSASQRVNTTCGIHIHLGLPDSARVSKWRPEHIRTFLAIGLAIEDRLFSVCPPSRASSPHCKRIRDVYTPRDIGAFYPVGVVKPNKRENPKRYCWLNLIETRRVGTKPSRQYGAGPALGTVEIRMLGATARREYVEAWVALWLKVAGLVAHVPSSLAILQCTYAGGLDAEFAALAACRASCTPQELTPVCLSSAPSIET